MSIVRFPSVGNTQIAYAISHMSFERMDVYSCGLSPFLKAYDTRHDEEIVQYGRFRPVVENNVIDFLYSMAAHCMEHPEDVREIDLCWPRKISPLDLATASKIKYPSSSVDGEPLYYEVNSLAISAQYRRKNPFANWEKIPKWANGGLESTFNLLRRSSIPDVFIQYPLGRLALYVQLHDWFRRIQAVPVGQILLGIKEPEELMRAFRVADNVVESQRLLKHIDKQIEQYREKNAVPPQIAPHRKNIVPGPGR